MPTQFTATVKPSSGDYTSLNNAATGLANDITLATIKVFSISAYSTPTIAAGDTVLGQTSLSTGVCVLVNAARTQILIKTIAVASFLSGEVVQKTADANTNVTLSNAGDSPIIGIECYSMSDTTPVVISGYITSLTNYIHIYTPMSERHNGKWNDTKYRIEVANINGISIFRVPNVRIDGLQIWETEGNVWEETGAIKSSIDGEGMDADIYISNCIIRGTQNLNPSYSFVGLYATTYGDGPGSGNCWMWNNIIYNFFDTSTIGTFIWGNFNIYFYNNTIYNCDYGFSAIYGICLLKNNISYNNTIDYSAIYPGEFDINSTNNLSKDNTAPPYNTYYINKTLTFISTGTDFHLAPSDTDAIGKGVTNPGSGLFLDDIDGLTRTIPWDIGATKYKYIYSKGCII